MIKVTPAYDADAVKALCDKEGIVPEANALCYFIYVDDVLGGICLFKFIKGGGRIMALRNTKEVNDRDALIIAGRACLDFIERNSGYDAYFEEEDLPLAKALGFKEKEGQIYLDLHGYFGTCGGGCSAKK
ncbi:MAG: hypothetical protein IJC49_00570 [Clostridia bacterium]|nr:hypothetical protein [Clostridia bacterium]